MANNAVGEIICPICKQVDEVRRNAKGKLYIYCEKYGIIQPARPAFQEWIRERTRFTESVGNVPPGRTSDRPEPEAEAAQDWQPEEAQQQEKAATAAEKAKTPPAAGRAVLNFFLGEDA